MTEPVFNEIEKDQVEQKLAEMRRKICALSDKLNTYVQLNGCSPELKDHAKKVLSKIAENTQKD